MKLTILNILFEISACYEPYVIGADSTNCLSETDMDNIFELIEKLGNVCFDPKGKIEAI